jgi:hypothetical protein
MKMLRDIWETLMTGDPLLVMVTVFCGTYALLMIAIIIFAFCIV